MNYQAHEQVARCGCWCEQTKGDADVLIVTTAIDLTACNETNEVIVWEDIICWF